MTHANPFSSYVRDVPDFPKAGILFRDITPLLANAAVFGEAVAARSKSVV